MPRTCNRWTASPERPHVGGPVDTEGQSAYDRGTRPSQGETKLLGGITPAARGLPGAYDGHTSLPAQKFETATAE